MRKTTYIYTVLCIITIVFLTVNCTDYDLIKSGTQSEVKDFSLQEAKEYFQSQVETNLTLSRSLDTKKDKSVSPGDFVPEWDAAVGSLKNGLACYDVPIIPTHRFKAIYVDERNGIASAGKVNVYQKLVVVKDVKNNRMSQYILTLIPSKAYETKNGTQICNKFINCADKGGFTGVAIYSCVYSRMTARVSTYKDGVKTQGIFLLDATSKTELAEKYAQVRILVSNISLQKCKNVTTRGENSDDYFYDGGELDEVVIVPEPDYDGGELDEVVVTPEPDYSFDWDKWLEESRPDGTVDPEPKDIEPLPDYSEENTIEENPGKNPDEKIVPLSEMEKQRVDKLMEQLKTMKKKDISKYTVAKQQACRSTARTSKDGELLLCELFFKSSNIQDIDRMTMIWHEMYHIDKEHYKAVSVKIDFDNTEILNPPPHIEKIIKDKLTEEYGDAYIDPSIFAAVYESLITEKNHCGAEYYENELETHEAERANFPNVSDFYERERVYLEWYYQEMLNLVNEQSKK